MSPLFDLIANAQNGKGVDLLARQFNLNQQQTQLAIDALLPAFSEGLKRNTAEPMGLAGLMQAMLGGQQTNYFDNAAAAFSPGGIQDGNGVLGQWFGSKELSRAVAAQAQAATGIGQDVLKQMLPVLAAMLMGGLAKQGAAQMQAASGMGGGAANPFGQLIEQMMRQGMGAGMGGGMGGTQQAQQPGPMDNPFGKILEQMMGGATQAPQTRSSGGTGNPWIDMLEQMAGGAQGQPEPQPRRRPTPQPAREPEPQPQERARNPLEDMLGQMFDTGRTVQRDYEQGVKSIFDQYVKNMDRLK